MPETARCHVVRRTNEILFQLLFRHSDEDFSSATPAYSCMQQEWNMEAFRILTNYRQKSSIQSPNFYKIYCLSSFTQYISLWGILFITK